MTQEDLAEKAGLSYKFIGEIERSQGNPTIDSLLAIGRALQVDVVDLFGRPPDPLAVERGYALPAGDAQRVREALASLEDVFKHVAPSPPYRRRRRK